MTEEKSTVDGTPKNQMESQSAPQSKDFLSDASATQNATDALTFRQAMSELDAIVAELDSNTLELEDSLKKYERGVVLVRTLRARLDEAQQKVDVLMGELEPEADDVKTDTTLS